MKIINLVASNVKRLLAVDITPQGNVVVIGGKNGAGKSSCLDAIEYALGGDPSAKMPVRRGEEKARIVLDLGDLIVKRTFTAAGGTSLVVTNADGVKQMSPQGILDKLVGKLTFDPLNFARQKPQQQAETMRALVGLDFAALDVAREKLFDERTAVNRHVKNLEAQLSAMPKYDAPAEEVSGTDILTEQQKASDINAANKALRDAYTTVKDLISGCNDDIDFHKSEVAAAQVEIDRWTAVRNKATQNLDAAGKQFANLESSADKAHKAAEAATDIDLEKFKTKLAIVEETNRKVRSNVQRSDLVAALKKHSEDAEKMTSRLEKMDSDKRAATTNAKYPVPGLLFDASGGITLNGIPFEQCSAAEQLKVSIAVGFALNPKLRVLLVRDGSLLDEDSMNVLVAMAKEADAQVWIERVETDAHTSVVIEDGHVQGVEPPEISGASESDTVAQPPGSEARDDKQSAGVGTLPKEKCDLPAPSKPSKLKRGQTDLI
jgi:DNA repair exonuclease SbcCD ATPase subunit